MFNSLLFVDSNVFYVYIANQYNKYIFLTAVIAFYSYYWGAFKSIMEDCDNYTIDKFSSLTCYHVLPWMIYSECLEVNEIDIRGNIL